MLQKFTIYQPNGWDNSILPIDTIHKLINEMNNVIDYINNMEDRSVERAKEYTDGQIDIVEASIATTNNTVDQINNSLQASIRGLNQSITVLQSQLSTYGERLNEINSRELDHYAEIGRTITQIYSDMRDLGAQLRNYADLKDIVLKEQLEAEIEELRVVINNVLEVETIDGLTGLKRSVRQILSTYIIDKVKNRGGNRWALSWGKFKLKSWLQTESTSYPNFRNYDNYWAPTWYNIMKGNSAVKEINSTFNAIWNTWGAFVNNTSLFITKLIADLYYFTSYSGLSNYNNYLNFDVFNYTEWNNFNTFNQTQLPSVTTVDVTGTYSGSSTHRSLIKSRMTSSYYILHGMQINNNSFIGGSSSLFDVSNSYTFYNFLMGVFNEAEYTTLL